MYIQVYAARLTSLDLDKKLGLENVIPKRAEEAIKVCDAILGKKKYLQLIFKGIRLKLWIKCNGFAAANKFATSVIN